MILTHPALTKLTFMDYLLTMLRILLRRKMDYDSKSAEPSKAKLNLVITITRRVQIPH